MNNIIRTLCSIKHFMFKGYQNLVYSREETEEEEYTSYVKEWSNYLKLLSEIFEFEIKLEDILWESGEDFISSYLKNYLEEDKIGQIVFDRFGHETYLFYDLLNNSLALQYVLSFIENIEEDLTALKKDYVNREYNFAKSYIKNFENNLSKNEHTKIKYLTSQELYSLDALVLALKDQSSLEIIKNKSDEYVNAILINHIEIDFTLHIAKILINNLEACKPGIKDWKNYEDVTFDILKYLFSPQFHYIFKQARTHDNHQIRDIIMPNYQSDGFFKNIKEEFDSKNIIIESKNGSSKSLNKDSLNQLRIYLNKKTIGRFGMLFIRKNANQSILKSQKLAYEENSILILIIDDEKLKKMILSKALLGNCEHYLYKLKMDFEINY